MSKNYMVYHSSRGLEAQRQAFMLLYIPRVSLHDNPRALYPITAERYKAGGGVWPWLASGPSHIP